MSTISRKVEVDKGKASFPGIAKKKDIKFKTFLRNTVLTAMQQRGWVEVDAKESSDDSAWDIYWADRDWMASEYDQLHLESGQRVNHFRNDRELCRKDLLVKNLKKHKRTLARSATQEECDSFDFWPTTYVLPGDYALFAEQFKKQTSSSSSALPAGSSSGPAGGAASGASSTSNAWIMKPIGRSQGKGIFLFTKLKDIEKWKKDSRFGESSSKVDHHKEGGKGSAADKEPEAYVVQRYIANPYLVGGRKFDMRIYALVTTFMPLTVWLYRDGFCRFSSARYSNNVADLENAFVHLTNVAVQKKSEGYSADPFGGKWDLRHLKLYLMSRHGSKAVDTLFSQMVGIILKSLQAVQAVVIQDKHCFELYGYDILFDEDLKPWLVEVNASPSMSASTLDDAAMKVAMLSSLFDIVDLEGKRTGDEVRIGGFDLITQQQDRNPSSSSSSSSSSWILIPRPYHPRCCRR